MKHMTWKKQPLLGETYDVKKSNRFRWNTWGDKGKKKQHLRQHIVLHSRSDDISFVENHILRQNTKYLKGKIRQKKATFEADSFCVWNIWREKEKRSNIWDSIWYFTAEAKIYLLSKIIFYPKHKILKRQKNGNIWSGQFWWNIWSEKRQPIWLKHMR